MSKLESETEGRFEDIWQGILPGLEPLPPGLIDNNQDCPVHVNDKIEESIKEKSPDELVFLKARLKQENAIFRYYEALIKKCHQQTGKMLIPLARAQKQILSRIMTTYFLKTGIKCEMPSSCTFVCSIPYAVRNLYNEELNSVREYKTCCTDIEQIKKLCEEITQVKLHNASELEKILESIILK